MAKVRFVGSEPHHVPVLNQTVEPDQLVTVDDDLFKSLDWPEENWSVVEKKSTAKDKG